VTVVRDERILPTSGSLLPRPYYPTLFILKGTKKKRKLHLFGVKYITLRKFRFSQKNPAGLSSEISTMGFQGRTCRRSLVADKIAPKVYRFSHCHTHFSSMPFDMGGPNPYKDLSTCLRKRKEYHKEDNAKRYKVWRAYEVEMGIIPTETGEYLRPGCFAAPPRRTTARG
jgi:hypothetical protein